VSSPHARSAWGPRVNARPCCFCRCCCFCSLVAGRGHQTPARLGEPLPSPSPVARAYSSIGVGCLARDKPRRTTAARGRGFIYGLFIYPHGRALPPHARRPVRGDPGKTLSRPWGFINDARPGGWAGGGALVAPGAAHRGVGRRRAALPPGRRKDRAKRAPCRTYSSLALYLVGLYLWSFNCRARSGLGRLVAPRREGDRG